MADQVRASFDAEHGGRWTSLVTDGREWLWHNPDTATREARQRVVLGDAFVDAGGGEECLPTVRGVPDHGDVWSRPWQVDGDTMRVATEEFTLSRTVTHESGRLVVDFEVTGRPHARLVHATHLLLDLGQDARLELDGTFPFCPADGSPWWDWPMADGVDVSRLGPDDGTAECWVLPGVRHCRVLDGEVLDLAWQRTDDGVGDLGLMLWRNLRGWPDGAPYRSIGVEPMLGNGAGWDDPASCADLGPSGRARWRLVVSAG